MNKHNITSPGPGVLVLYTVCSRQQREAHLARQKTVYLISIFQVYIWVQTAPLACMSKVTILYVPILSLDAVVVSNNELYKKCWLEGPNLFYSAVLHQKNVMVEYH